MSTSTNSAQNRRSAGAFAIAAGLLLVAYPALRPWSDKAGVDSSTAAAFASSWWVIAHTAAMLGFTALALSLRALRPTAAFVRGAELRAWIAVAFLGPYFGAEAFVLHEIGIRAQETGATEGGADILDLADKFRYAPIPVAMFAIGLLALAWTGARLISIGWPTGAVGPIATIVAGLGLIAFLPQFFLPPWFRVAHGIVLGLGLVAWGLVLLRGDTTSPGPRTGS